MLSFPSTANRAVHNWEEGEGADFNTRKETHTHSQSHTFSHPLNTQLTLEFITYNHLQPNFSLRHQTCTANPTQPSNSSIRKLSRRHSGFFLFQSSLPPFLPGTPGTNRHDSNKVTINNKKEGMSIHPHN